MDNLIDFRFPSRTYRKTRKEDPVSVRPTVHTTNTGMDKTDYNTVLTLAGFGGIAATLAFMCVSALVIVTAVAM